MKDRDVRTALHHASVEATTPQADRQPSVLHLGAPRYAALGRENNLHRQTLARSILRRYTRSWFYAQPVWDPESQDTDGSSRAGKAKDDLHDGTDDEGEAGRQTFNMARKITDEGMKDFLEKTGHAELVEWLAEYSHDDEKLGASVLDLAATKESAKALASEIRARIRHAWQLSSRRNGWKMALPISRELDQVLASIQSMMDKGCLAETEKLLITFVEAAQKGMAHTDDSYGYLWPTCQRGVTLWGEVWARTEPRDTKQLACLVYDHIHDNGRAIKDNMITKSTRALGEEGLHLLQWRLKGDLAVLPQPVRNEQIPNFDRVPVIGWLKEIADVLGDVDGYIATVESEQQKETYALGVSRRLFEAG